MDQIKHLESALCEATDKQKSLEQKLNDVILENENFRKKQANIKSLDFSDTSLNEKLKVEKDRRQKLESDIIVLREEFENQLKQQLEMVVQDTTVKLDKQIQESKQMTEEQGLVYKELENLKLQLAAAEQIINENSEYKRQVKLEMSHIQETLSNRENTIEKMIKECTLECEERVRFERSRALKIQSDCDHKINDLQRETALAKASEERAKRQQQRAEISLQNEKDNSGLGRLEEEISNLRIKLESLERLKSEVEDECELIRGEQTKMKLDHERELAAMADKNLKLTKNLENERDQLNKNLDQKFNFEDKIANLTIELENLKNNNNASLSTALSEQAKKIEQVRADAQHWKSCYDVLAEEHKNGSNQLNSLFQQERLLNKKYRNEISSMQSGYENKLRKYSIQLKQYKNRDILGI